MVLGDLLLFFEEPRVIIWNLWEPWFPVIFVLCWQIGIIKGVLCRLYENIELRGSPQAATQEPEC